VADAPALNDDFVDMLQALSDAKVEFLIVGAHAMAAHGLPRATGDIDILVRPERANAARVISALRGFGAPIDSHGVTQRDFEETGTVYQIGLPPRRIDLLTEITGVTFEEAWDSRIEAQLAGRSVAVIGYAALLQNKRATGRDKDLVDARWLEQSAATRKPPS
jgi:hypothetical protein